MRFRFLGTGTSFGVPVVGCGCPVCRSTDPRDARYRSCLLIESGGTVLVIDAGPEFRLQALRAGLCRLDALLLTHAHADHVGGLDDVRPLTRERVLPVYGDEGTLAEVRERFGYIFRTTQEGGGKPRIELRPASGPLRIGDIELSPIPVMHGELTILGWRTGDFAYLTDASGIPDSSYGLLSGVRTLVINGLRRRPHSTHFSIDQALDAARRIGASRAWITHLCHESTHVELEEYCAARGADVGARPAWDGLEAEA